MRKHLDVQAYWNDVGPRLAGYLKVKRNAQVEDCLRHALALFSFIQETFVADATKNQTILKHTGIMLVHVHDVIRGLVSAQADLSPVSVAALLRIALEVRCNHLFIIKSNTPEMYAERFSRYASVERILREEYAPPGTPSLLSQAAEQEIRKTCGEWFKSSGKVSVKHWTAEDNYKTLKALADKVGLSAEYSTMYSIASKFIHGSALLENMYSQQGGLGALVDPQRCSNMSLLAAMQCIKLLQEAAVFYGVPPFEDDLLAWHTKWVACVETLG